MASGAKNKIIQLYRLQVLIDHKLNATEQMKLGKETLREVQKNIASKCFF